MAQALGARFYDAQDQLMADGAGGGDLSRVARADLSGLDERLGTLEMTVACDVTNPLLGPEGATYTYGRQKGADEEKQKILEEGMASYARAMARDLGKDWSPEPGAGAAGGTRFRTGGLLRCPDPVGHQDGAGFHRFG